MELSSDLLTTLRSFDSCTISNAIERIDIRLRNEGFTNSSIRCRFPEFPSMVGYAVTLRMHGSNPPMEGGTYKEPPQWWNEIDEQPCPRVVVIEDADRRAGTAAFVGETHAAILKALGCVGVVTNGAVRDLPGVHRLGVQLYSGSVSVSHAYAHVAATHVPVVVAGLTIRAGDLLHGDEHGIVKVPRELAAEVARIAAQLKGEEARIVELCQSREFTREKLRELLRR